jgi:glyoxylase-like metal-dependent hydrolase (beta-lactamase superfamily II)
MLKATASRLKWILVTHTHRDHSPAALPIAQATGAKLVGNIIPNDGFQDETFQGATSLKNDELISNKEFSIRALLTPGHVSNHICYLVEEDKILITGDHMMQGSTVVIVPPAGSMKDYIDSLKRMQTYDVNYVAPGHGDLIEEPGREIMRLIDHRLKREKKVYNALTNAREATIDELVPVVYDDVDPALHKWAAMSLHAHLIKLEIEQSVAKNGKYWIIA